MNNMRLAFNTYTKAPSLENARALVAIVDRRPDWQCVCTEDEEFIIKCAIHMVRTPAPIW